MGIIPMHRTSCHMLERGRQRRRCVGRHNCALLNSLRRLQIILVVEQGHAEDDASALDATNDNRLAAQIGAVALLDGRIEGIHIDMNDRRVGRHGRGRPTGVDAVAAVIILRFAGCSDRSHTRRPHVSRLSVVIPDEAVSEYNDNGIDYGREACVAERS